MIIIDSVDNFKSESEIIMHYNNLIKSHNIRFLSNINYIGVLTKNYYEDFQKRDIKTIKEIKYTYYYCQPFYFKYNKIKNSKGAKNVSY